ncbi:MAG: hypothetical protein NVSMB5_26860 [Candidatus Velthaea sp.]
MPTPTGFRLIIAAPEARIAATPARSSGLPGARAAVDHVAAGSLRGIRYGRELADAAEAYHLDPTLVAAVAAQESGGPGATSGRADAGTTNPYGKGLMQLNPEYHPFARTSAAYDPARSAREGAKVLRENLDRTHGDVREALRQYNCGPSLPSCQGEVSRWSDGPMRYAESVLRHQHDIRQFVRK